MSIFIYEDEEICVNYDIALQKIENMVSSLDYNNRDHIRVIRNYIENFLKIFKSVSNSNIKDLHRSLCKDLQRVDLK